MLYKHRHKFGVISVFCIYLFLLGCSNNKSDNIGETSTFSVTGVVSELSPVANVKVSVNGKSTTTDLNGFYRLSDINVPVDGRAVMTFEKDGYAVYQRSVSVDKGQSYSISARLLKYQFSDTLQADAAGDQQIDVTDPENPANAVLAKISFPEGSIGATGEVSVKVATADATSEEGRAVFPGDYIAVDSIGDTGEPSLESVAFTEITVSDSTGAEITTLEKPADIQVKLPDEFQVGGEKEGTYIVGDVDKGFIEWWSYDETKGIWIREDADPSTTEIDNALIVSDDNGILYAKAKVTHFSWWNADRPISQHSCLGVTVLDEAGDPIVGAQVFADGVSYNGRSSPAKTNINGIAYLNVKKSVEGETPEKVKIYVDLGGHKLYYDVTDSSKGDVELDIINTSTVQGSTLYGGSGECSLLANSISYLNNGVVKGQVTYENSGDAAVGFKLYTDLGHEAVTDKNGRYEIKIPLEIPVTLFAIGLESQTVSVSFADDPTEAIANFILPNFAPEISELTRTPEGTIELSSSVNLSVVAADPEGEEVTITWSVAGEGVLKSTTGTSNVWTAPDADAGTDVITIVATDTQGASSQITHKIIWGGGVSTKTGTVGGTRLKFIFSDQNDGKVAGVVVALYNQDNKTIARTLTSDETGVVDFGDIGKERATYTIAYINEYDSSTVKMIMSYVDVLAGEFPMTVNFSNSVNNVNSDEYCTPPIASPSFNVSNRPDNISYSTISPVYAFQHGATPDPVQADVCSEYTQDNGKISYLAIGYDSNSVPIKYGQLIDQTISQDVTTVIDISLDKTPVGLGWTTKPATKLNSLSIYGMRSRQYYPIVGTPSLGESGVVPYLADFPVDYYWLRATADNNGTTLSIQKQYSQLPQSVQVDLPDFRFVNPSFDGTVVNTETTGTTPVDMITLSFSEIRHSDDFPPPEGNFWSVTQSGTKDTWEVMELPSPVNTWIDIKTLRSSSNYTHASMTIQDIEDYDSFDSYWVGVSNGSATEGEINRTMYRSGNYILFSLSPSIIQKPRQKAAQGVKVVSPARPIRPLSEMWRK